MDREWVAQCREALQDTGWWWRAQTLGHAVRRTSEAGSLLIVGTPETEPWHLVAHLDDEARLAGPGRARPTLVRWNPPVDAPPHLAVTLARLESAGRDETVFVVAPELAPEALLERVEDARRMGATVLCLDSGDPQWESLAHERMAVTPAGLVVPNSAVEVEPGLAGLDGFEVAGHLISAASGAEAPRR